MQRPAGHLCQGAARAYERWRWVHTFSEAGEHLFVDIERASSWPRPVSRLQQVSTIVAALQPFQAARVGR
jgi:hypothetical protein